MDCSDDDPRGGKGVNCIRRTVPTQPRSRSVTALGDDATVPEILPWYLYPDTGRVGKGLTGSSPDSTGFLSSLSVHHVTWLLGMAQCHRQSLKARRESRCHALSHDSRDRPYHQSAQCGCRPTAHLYAISLLELSRGNSGTRRRGPAGRQPLAATRATRHAPRTTLVLTHGIVELMAGC